jgi:hypothetical protein
VCDALVVQATNVGSRPTSEKAVTLSDTVPAGLTVQQVWIFARDKDLVESKDAVCSESPGGGTLVKCSIPISFFASQPEPDRHILPDGSFRMYVAVTVDEPAVPGVLVNHASVSGGGIAGEASTSSEATLEQSTAAFGLSVFTAALTGADGLVESQAGAHPYGLFTPLAFNGSIREDPQGGFGDTSVQDPRDIVVDLPVGVAGSGTSAARCTLARLASNPKGEREGQSGCPAATIVGHIRTLPVETDEVDSPVYNLIPEHGHAAELGFVDAINTTHVLYVSLAPTPAGYVLRTTSSEIPQIKILEILAQIYGDPAARARALEGVEEGRAYVYGTKSGDVPTFTNPADCNGEPLVTAVHLDSWQSPGSYNADGTPNFNDPRWVKSSFESEPATTGCEALAGLFNPSLSAVVSPGVADSPTGLDVGVRVPQSEGVEALGTPPLRNTVVTLPEGMTVDPSSANGLGVCSEAQIGWQGSTPAGAGELENFNAAPPGCPDASKVGTLELETPALPSEACKEATVPLQECPNASEREKTPLSGSIYVASQNANPFGSLLALYFVVDDPRTGVIVKLPAEVQADPVTGRLTTVLRDTAQFPFSELRTHFFAGDTAALKAPASCGSFGLTSVLTPWSAPQSGPPATPSGSFEVAQAPGGACGAAGFAPSFTAGTVSSRAGAFSSFGVTFSRQDGEQNLGGASVTLPPGLLGVLKGVALCGEPQAAQGACPAGSLIGEATAAVGAGGSPYWVHGGQVYLTGPYNGGPFGLSIVVPTTAGPYTLTGNAGVGREVVRASVRVDPSTAQIGVVSDPLPSIIQGIPLDIRTVNVTVNRQGFMFNPTNCNPLSVTGALTSTVGASAGVSSAFHASGCQALAFKPSFKVSTQAKTSKRDGASLDVRVAYPAGGQANIHSVAVTLPKQLPSRLTTIQQACPQATFDANPAGCPAGSVIGTAVASTPVLAGPVAGPAYLVSHGGAAFPDLVLVLQGEGVTLQLIGSVDIKKQVTSSAFNSVPDAPVSSFELKLPEGPHSGLAAVLPAKAKGNLCGTSLTMPTTLTGQDGAIIKQNTKITITGCPKAKKQPKPKHNRRRKKR